jgi:hypothetical protein
VRPAVHTFVERRGRESNPLIAVLQTAAFPLGYPALWTRTQTMSGASRCQSGDAACSRKHSTAAARAVRPDIREQLSPGGAPCQAGTLSGIPLAMAAFSRLPLARNSFHTLAIRKPLSLRRVQRFRFRRHFPQYSRNPRDACLAFRFPKSGIRNSLRKSLRRCSAWTIKLPL